ncbi:hypothetical protein COOONC_03639 [Cooperia oncophora]
MAPSNDSSIVNRFPSIDLSIRPSLHQILEQPEQFFHISQQSAKLKRRADIERYRESVMKPASLRQVGTKAISQDNVDIEQVTLTMEVTYSDYEEMFTKRCLETFYLLLYLELQISGFQDSRVTLQESLMPV